MIDLKQEEEKQPLQKLLYVDGLNFVRNFFLNMNFWDLDSAFENIKRFVEAAYNTGYDVEVFIDSGIQSKETLDMWIKKREESLKTCSMDCPACITAFLGEMFRNLKIKVHYCLEDKSDTMACFADHFGADIMSNSTEFVRYKQRKFNLFKAFEINKVTGKLILTHRKPFQHNDGQKFISDKLHPILKEYPLLPEVRNYAQYYRSSPTNITKYTGNLHGLIKPLRQVFYRIMNVNFEVFEIYLYWDLQNDQPAWVKEFVKPADENLLNQLNPLFNNITSIIDFFIDELVRPALR
eukprot:403368305